MHIIKLEPLKPSSWREGAFDCSSEPFSWVAHPNGLLDCSMGNSAKDATDIMKKLVARRLDIEILGGVVDEEASYDYDELALIRLDGEFYLLNTSGCSCPSADETWGVPLGPTSLSVVRTFIESGSYSGYTLPKEQVDQFLAIIDEAMKETT